MDIESWLAFVTIWLVACFGVGPNSVTCATAGATNGIRRGMWSAFGITAASSVHSMVAVFGFSTLLLVYAEAYVVLKWLGIAYLVYLGMRLWWKGPTKFSMQKGELESRAVLFRRAFMISISNPQAILTYLAFFTPALNPNAPLVPQMLVLVPTAVGVVSLMYTGYVFSGTPLSFIITSATRQVILNRITGTFYFVIIPLTYESRIPILRVQEVSNMAKSPTVHDFFKKFPTDEACLEHLMMVRFGNPMYCPKCGAEGQFAKLKKLPAYACPTCGHHIHPMVGTPFERSRTPLTKWFYAMYLFTTSRHGVPAKELQRQLGVTYKTAWRMGHQIRKYMGTVDGDPPLGGHVEADETYIGGRRSGGKRGRGAPGKTVVFGMVERGGDVMTRVVPNVRRATLERHILEKIQGGATVSTDELTSYAKIARFGYDHGTVNHSADQWVDGIHHTNSIEGFWSMLKRSIRGTHIHVSRKHLSKYLGEFEYRWNSRHAPETMFARLLMSF